jgi:hypothetical protein
MRYKKTFIITLTIFAFLFLVFIVIWELKREFRPFKKEDFRATNCLVTGDLVGLGVVGCYGNYIVSSGWDTKGYTIDENGYAIVGEVKSLNNIVFQNPYLYVVGGSINSMQYKNSDKEKYYLIIDTVNNQIKSFLNLNEVIDLKDRQILMNLEK